MKSQKVFVLEVWGLELHLGRFAPKEIPSHTSRTLAPIFKSISSFFLES